MSDKDEFVERLKTQLDDWNAQITKMEAEARKAAADSKVQYEENLEKMRAQRDQAQQKLAELQKAGDSAWDDMRKGAEDMWATMEESFKKAMSRFR